MNPKIQSITFDGLPPSVNTIYRNVKGRGRVKSERYRKWINSVNWQLNAQAPQKIDGEVEVSQSRSLESSSIRWLETSMSRTALMQLSMSLRRLSGRLQ